MQFTLTINCDNAAFDGNPLPEIARILRVAAGKADDGNNSMVLLDVNGNVVGNAQLEAEDGDDGNEDQDEAENIAQNVEELYDLGRAGDEYGLEDAFRTYVDANRLDDIDPDNVDYAALAAFLRESDMGNEQAQRWMVVDKDNSPVHKGMYRHNNAQDEADRLNREGLAEYRPYRVVPDTVAMTSKDEVSAGPEYDQLCRLRNGITYLAGIARCNLTHVGSSESAAEAMVREGLARWVPNEDDPDNRDVDLLEWENT